jgi:hypothetical protein
VDPELKASEVDWYHWKPRELWNCKTADDFGVDDTYLSDPLGELDLEAYAGAIEESVLKEKGVSVSVHRKLQLVKQELRFPYFDRRQPFRAPNTLELFEALSGEQPASLPVGMLVRVRVMKVDGKFGVSVRVHELTGLLGQVCRSLGT